MRSSSGTNRAVNKHGITNCVLKLFVIDMEHDRYSWTLLMQLLVIAKDDQLEYSIVFHTYKYCFLIFNKHIISAINLRLFSMKLYFHLYIFDSLSRISFMLTIFTKYRNVAHVQGNHVAGKIGKMSLNSHYYFVYVRPKDMCKYYNVKLNIRIFVFTNF